MAAALLRGFRLTLPFASVLKKCRNPFFYCPNPECLVDSNTGFSELAALEHRLFPSVISLLHYHFIVPFLRNKLKVGDKTTSERRGEGKKNTHFLCPEENLHQPIYESEFHSEILTLRGFWMLGRPIFIYVCGRSLTLRPDWDMTSSHLTSSLSSRPIQRGGQGHVPIVYFSPSPSIPCTFSCS